MNADFDGTPPLTWTKSSYSAGDGGQCVEAARTADAVHVRDSKRIDGPILTVSAERWAAFLEFAARG